MAIALKRIYDPPDRDDGQRVLVERLWPRGLSRNRAHVDFWLKEVAPSHELRRWFSHDPAKWLEFKRRYFDELERAPAALGKLWDLLRQGTVTFVYASREQHLNNAVALKEYVEESSPPHTR